MIIRLISFLTATLCVITMAVPGCGNRGGRGTSRQFPAHLKVFYSAGTYGSMFPCGCHVPLGGLSRRAGVITQDKDTYPDQLVIDAGTFASGSTAYDRFAAGFMLRAYVTMGYQAVNVGKIETENPVSQIREWDQLSGGMLISANLVDSQNLPVTRKYLIRRIGGINIGITGMTAAGTQPPGAEELPKVILPVPPLQDVMAEFKKENVDFVVLLADTVQGEVEAILKEVPEINLVVIDQGLNLAGTQPAEVIGSTRIVSIGDLGKHLGWLRLDFQPDGTVTSDEVGQISLDNSVPTLSSITELLIAFKTELRARRDEFIGNPGNPFQVATPPDFVDILTGYAGQAQCMSCHVGYALDQQLAGHMQAWTILDEQNRTNPECLKCHTTGYGIPTGTQDPYRDTHLSGVTCEACHGPGSDHVRQEMAKKQGIDPASMLPYENPTGLGFHKEVPVTICLGCHTQQWSPAFDYATWVPRINHASMKNRPQIINPETGEVIEPNIIDDGTQTSTGQ